MDATTPITLIGTLSYRELKRYLRQVHKDLPDELTSCIADFLVVLPVNPTDIAVTKASSDRQDYPLSKVLLDDNRTWWISENDSMPRGRGEQYLQFRLSSESSPRRVCSVSISIPPHHSGPLSVRDFRVDYSLYDGAFKKGDFIMTLDPLQSGLQRFDLSRIDATDVRLVCLSNQASAQNFQVFSSVGLYAVLWN